MSNEKRLIDADVLREEIYAYVFPITANNLMGAADSYYRILHLLENAPTVEAVPVVHGRWIDGCGVDHSGKEVYKSIDCSNCEEVFKIESEDREYWKKRFKACPFCGAVMNGWNEDDK